VSALHAFGSAKLTQRRAAKDVTIVISRGQLAAIDSQQPQPIARAEQLERQTSLNVPAQERVLEVVEDAAPMETQVGASEAAAGDRRDEVHFVEERASRAADRDRCVGQPLQCPICEAGGTGPAARESQDQEHSP